MRLGKQIELCWSMTNRQSTYRAASGRRRKRFDDEWPTVLGERIDPQQAAFAW